MSNKTSPRTKEVAEGPFSQVEIETLTIIIEAARSQPRIEWIPLGLVRAVEKETNVERTLLVCVTPPDPGNEREGSRYTPLAILLDPTEAYKAFQPPQGLRSDDPTPESSDVVEQAETPVPSRAPQAPKAPRPKLQPLVVSKP